jgi:hypothetical protein
MKFRQIAIVLTFLWMNISVAGQQSSKQVLKNKIKRLEIGDKIPSIPIAKMMDTEGNLKSINLTQYNDRLLILDLMNTRCSSCLEGLPEKDSLQKKFGDKIKMMVVTPEDESYMTAYFKNKKSYPVRKGVRLPWIVEDNLLQRYFPYVFTSHLVWIYKGKVAAITWQEYVDEGNIKKILSGEVVNLPVKDDVLDFDYHKQSIFNIGNSTKTNASSFARYSVVSGYQAGLDGGKAGVSIDSLNQTQRIYSINQSPLTTYYRAFLSIYPDGPKHFLIANRTILEVKEPSRFIYDPSQGYYDLWRRKNEICYEAVFPLSMGVAASYEQMANDLDRFLGLHAHWEKRKVSCVVIVQKGSDEEIEKAKQAAAQFTYIAADGRAQQGKKSADGEIGKELTLQKIELYYSSKSPDNNKELPIVNEGSYKGTIILPLDVIKNISSLRIALQPYGLEIKQEEREIEMFVITERKN